MRREGEGVWTYRRRIIIRVLVVALVAIAAANAAVWGANAATAGSGTGIQPGPVCLGTPLEPGHSYELETNGFSDVKGADVTNTGTGTEDLALAVSRQAWNLPGMRVPSSWVTFGYPKHLLILTSHSVSVAAGGTAIIPVTVNVPSGAARGTYVAGLTVSSGTGSGGAQLGTGAEAPMIFTVGISKPGWTPKQMAATGNCWTPAGAYESWQQWAGSSYPAPPPGWHWEAGQVNSWAYTPPPGWYENGSTMRQVYRGGKAVVTCASAALWTRRDGLLNDEYPWIGGQYPDTSTPADCAAWLAASKAGTLGTEPAIGGSPGHADLGPVPALASSAAPASSTPAARVLAVAVLLFIGAMGVAVRVAMAVRRIRRTARRPR
jgi:hypothetical protein